MKLGTPGLKLGTPRRVTALIVALLLGASGFIPQFGGPGYEAALAAGVVYRKLGLSLLRKAWFNMDWLWAGALVLTGLVVLLK